MEPKKRSGADIDRQTLTLRLAGTAVALLIIIGLFSWTVYERSGFTIEAEVVFEEEEEIADVTKQQEQPPPPPPPELEIVEDDVEIEEDQPDILESDDFDIDIDIPDDEPGEEIDEPEIFTVVEDMPTFPGGEQRLFEYLRRNIRYPDRERSAGTQGIVQVSFVVMEDGSISDVQILRGVSTGLDREAVRVIEGMPNWEPGRQRNQAVKVRVNLPIRFTLN